MTLRLKDQSKELHPVYDDENDQFTLVFHYGGLLLHLPTSRYIGGDTCIYDYVEEDEVSLLYLDEMCNDAGILGHKKYYLLEENKFVHVQRDRELYVAVKGCHASRLVELYVEQIMPTTLLSQVGSSNDMATEANREEDDNEDNSEDKDENEVNDDTGDENQNDDPKNDEDQGDSTSDSEYSAEEDSDYDMNEDKDDGDYEANVDKNYEYSGMSEDGGNDDRHNADDRSDEELSDDGSTDVAESEDELRSLHGSDDDREESHVKNLNPAKDMELVCGLRFMRIEDFQEAVKIHSVTKGRPISIYRSEKSRCSAKCKNPGCGWNANLAFDRRSGKFEIRTMNSKHKCSFSSRNSAIRSGWIAKRYLNDFIAEPNPNLNNFRKKVMTELRCCISKSQAFRVKEKALELIRGKEANEYALIWNYMEEIKRTDSTATILVKTTIPLNDDIPVREEDIILREANIPLVIDQPRFQRLYCCLSAMKKGMISGCRKIFGIDGCHLKSRHGGMLLTAVGIDPNNNLFPIAHAAVEGETKNSWIWFLRNVREDLGIEMDHEWTLISDKQKGLIQACEEVFPAAHHRFCVRHLHANWALAGFNGKTLKDALYAAASATTVMGFKDAMKKIVDLDPDAAKWLEDKPPYQWSRSHFSFMSKCDMLLNNVCESYNSVLSDAREMPILSLFEWIRNYHMVRFQKNRERARAKWDGKKICPKIMKRLDKNMEEAADYIAFKADVGMFQCSKYDGMQFCVDLKNHTCSCRKWELNGIPCSHACAAIAYDQLDAIDYVDDCYSVKTYLRVYNLPIMPASGPKQIPETGIEPILPPIVKRKPGRPKKLRKRSAGEAEIAKMHKERKKTVQKMSRVGQLQICGLCKKQGHNKRTCPDKILSQESSVPEIQVATSATKQKVHRRRSKNDISEAHHSEQVHAAASAPTQVHVAATSPTQSYAAESAQTQGRKKLNVTRAKRFKSTNVEIPPVASPNVEAPSVQSPFVRPQSVAAQSDLASFDVGLAGRLVHLPAGSPLTQAAGSPPTQGKTVPNTLKRKKAVVQTGEGHQSPTASPLNRVTRSASIPHEPVSPSRRPTRSLSGIGNEGLVGSSSSVAAQVPKQWPYYRKLKDSPRLVPNFWVRNEKIWMPREILKEVMEARENND